MTGSFVYLNSNSYTKDGNYRCYVTCSDTSGNVLTFNASGVPQDRLPVPYDVCQIDFDVNQYGNNQTSFIMKAIDITSHLIDPTDKK